MGLKALHLVSSGRSGTKTGPKARALRRRRLTATSLTSLRSEGEPFDLTDPECPGLQLHVAARLADGAEGTRSWQYRFRWRGKRVRATLGQYPETGIAAAHDLVRDARELLVKGIDPRKSGLDGKITRAAHRPCTRWRSAPLDRCARDRVHGALHHAEP